MITAAQTPAKLTMSVGRTHKQGKDFGSMDFTGLAALAANPTDLTRYPLDDNGKAAAAKENSPWFLPSDAQGKTKRAVQAHNRYTALVCDIDGGNHPLESVTERLQSVGVGSWVIYATGNHTTGEPRWRVVLPITQPANLTEWKAAQTHLASLLGGDNSALKDTQISYQPTLTARNRDHYRYDVRDGEAVSLACFAPPARPQPPAPPQPPRRPQPPAPPAPPQRATAAPHDITLPSAWEKPASAHSVIDAFNAAYQWDQLLTGYGYKKEHGGKWLHPDSTSGAAGVAIVYEKDAGGLYWSNHECDPLADGYAHSKWDVMVKRQFDGDSAAAMRYWGNELVTPEGQTITDANRDAHKANKTTSQANIDPRIAELNREFTHVTNGGKNYVVRTCDKGDGIVADYFPLKEFKDFFLNAPPVEIGTPNGNGETKSISVAEYWLKHPDKAFCPNGVTFDPTTTERFVNKRLNTYYGLAVQPIPHDLELIRPYLDHILYVICSGNEAHYEYQIKYWAHLFQCPEEKPEVAIVLESGQGTGKGVMMNPLAKIIGRHYFHAQDADSILGRFNSALENVMLLFGDEFFSGSKKATDKLKGLISEKTQTIERKGVDVITTRSYCRLVLASNHENMIRFETDERRYFYLKVSDCRKQDHAYFAQFFDKENGLFNHPDFHGMLLDYFLSVDLTGFNVRKPPHSEALVQSKLDSLDALDAWVYESLQRGSFVGNGWVNRVHADLVRDTCSAYLLNNSSSKIHGDLSRKVGKTLTSYGAERVRVRQGDGRVYYYEFPDLEVMRSQFAAKLRTELDWL